MATTETVRDIGAQMAKWDQQRRQAEINASLGTEFNPDNKTLFQNPDEFAADQARKIADSRLGAAKDNVDLANREYQETLDHIQAQRRIANEKAETNKARIDWESAANAAVSDSKETILTARFNSLMSNITEKERIAHRFSTEHHRELLQIAQEGKEFLTPEMIALAWSW
ncbi:MAG TPA: hypothetical protein VKJ45_12505, partial [Blastocatellia bacterium]|nr:hypothetical protein [Blastocatellia bacterium]